MKPFVAGRRREDDTDRRIHPRHRRPPARSSRRLQPPTQEPASLFPLVVALLRLRRSLCSLLGKDGNPSSPHARWLRSHVLPRSYKAFSQLAADNQHAPWVSSSSQFSLASMPS
uniref:Uncharacterized protein n=1 Tax=Bionectria ochroleuca TaxID=29856 RepID=A0A8H7KEJ4_BIOOC